MVEGPILLDSPQSVRHAILELALLTRQSLNIFTQDLDPALFDHKPFLDALRRLAISHKHARIRILLRDPRRAIKDGSRVIALARRLSSRMAVRVPGPDHQDYASAFVVADEAHVLFDQTPDRYTARLTRSDRPRARELMGFFNEVWEHGHVPTDLRELRL